VPKKKKSLSDQMEAGPPWLEVELVNLRSGLKRGTPLAEIAELLGRDPLQVQTKIEQLAAEHQYDPAHSKPKTPGRIRSAL
jgi:hypothetical protein